MMRSFLGVDVGSSKTHALVVDETGCCLGFGKAAGGNHQGVGYAGLERALRESAEAALAMARLSAADLAGAGFGVAGYDFPSDRPRHLQAIESLGLTCPVEVVNDGLNGLLAGATRGVGVNVTAGSSNNCRGRNRAGQEGRIVGNGAMFGEHGGGIEIVARGLQLINYAWIGRGAPTVLTDLYLEALGAHDVMDLMEGLSIDRYHLSAHMAPLVFRAAREGDAVAGELVRWAGEELGWLAVAVARQIGLDQDEVEIVLSGSLFQAGPLLIDPLRALVLQHCPSARLIRLGCPPVVGAVVLGMEQAGHDGYAVRAEITRTVGEVVP